MLVICLMIVIIVDDQQDSERIFYKVDVGYHKYINLLHRVLIIS